MTVLYTMPAARLACFGAPDFPAARHSRDMAAGLFFPYPRAMASTRRRVAAAAALPSQPPHQFPARLGNNAFTYPARSLASRGALAVRPRVTASRRGGQSAILPVLDCPGGLVSPGAFRRVNHV